MCRLWCVYVCIVGKGICTVHIYTCTWKHTECPYLSSSFCVSVCVSWTYLLLLAAGLPSFAMPWRRAWPPVCVCVCVCRCGTSVCLDDENKAGRVSVDVLCVRVGVWGGGGRCVCCCFHGFPCAPASQTTHTRTSLYKFSVRHCVCMCVCVCP